MKTNITISTDGMNEEKFEGIEAFKSEEEIEEYAKSAIDGIAKAMLTMKVLFPYQDVKTLYDAYSDKINERTNIEYMERLDASLKDSSISEQNDNMFYIDDIIELLCIVKSSSFNNPHKDKYLNLRSIVLSNCQMIDENVI